MVTLASVWRYLTFGGDWKCEKWNFGTIKNASRENTKHENTGKEKSETWKYETWKYETWKCGKWKFISVQFAECQYMKLTKFKLSGTTVCSHSVNCRLWGCSSSCLSCCLRRTALDLRLLVSLCAGRHPTHEEIGTAKGLHDRRADAVGVSMCSVSSSAAMQWYWTWPCDFVEDGSVLQLIWI